MGNPKSFQKRFSEDHLGTKSRVSHRNNGKQMADKSGQQPQVIQTKGE